MRIKKCKGENTFRLPNVPQTFPVPHTQGKILFVSPELLTPSAAVLLLLLEINLKKISEMAILEFPTSQRQRKRSEPVPRKLSWLKSSERLVFHSMFPHLLPHFPSQHKMHLKTTKYSTYVLILSPQKNIWEK